MCRLRFDRRRHKVQINKASNLHQLGSIDCRRINSIRMNSFEQPFLLLQLCHQRKQYIWDNLGNFEISSRLCNLGLLSSQYWKAGISFLEEFNRWSQFERILSRTKSNPLCLSMFGSQYIFRNKNLSCIILIFHPEYMVGCIQYK